MKLFYTLIITFLVGCTEDDDCLLRKHSGPDGSNYFTKGCLVDSLETGNTYTYDSLNNLLEWGSYDKGIKKGNWHYPRNQTDSIIAWQKYENDRLNFITNIPARLSVDIDSSFYVKFKLKDTNVFLKVVIGINNPLVQEIGIDSFYKAAEQDLIDNNFKYNSRRNEVISKRGRYYSNFYNISRPNSRNLQILTFYGNSLNNFIEISCIYQESHRELAVILFSSILSNIYIDSVRFIHPFEQIKVKGL